MRSGFHVEESIGLLNGIVDEEVSRETEFGWFLGDILKIETVGDSSPPWTAGNKVGTAGRWKFEVVLWKVIFLNKFKNETGIWDIHE